MMIRIECLGFLSFKTFMTIIEVVFGLNSVLKKHFSDTTKTLYISHSIPQKVSDFFADLVQGNPEMLKLDGSHCPMPYAKNDRVL